MRRLGVYCCEIDRAAMALMDGLRALGLQPIHRSPQVFTLVDTEPFDAIIICDVHKRSQTVFAAYTSPNGPHSPVPVLALCQTNEVAYSLFTTQPPSNPCDNVSIPCTLDELRTGRPFRLLARRVKGFEDLAIDPPVEEPTPVGAQMAEADTNEATVPPKPIDDTVTPPQNTPDPVGEAGAKVEKPTAPAPRKRGRPKGSKNRRKG